MSFSRMAKNTLHKNYRILIVDDDSQFHQLVRYAFQKGFEFAGAVNIPRLEEKLRSKEVFDLILLDLVLDNNTQEKVGLDLIPVIQGERPGVPIIVVTNDKSIDSVLVAIKRGAVTFLHKGDFDEELWEKTFRDVLDKTETKRENEELKQKLLQFEYINPPENPLIGSSTQIERIRKMLKVAADERDLTTLITGETGVGKGVAARFLHYNSPSRRDKPFEEIHISNIPKTLLESILFGAKKGTYTDAKEDIKGRLHMADEGIAFLDEIGDLDLESQLRLLQFLQTKTIRPVGFSKDIKLDVQVIAATNKNLREEVAKGNFRGDLYQRLNEFHIEIPPLRERRGDILDLSLHFLKCKEIEDLNGIMDEQVKDILLNRYTWVGNIRELEHTFRSSQRLQQRVFFTERITFECLPDDIQKFMQDDNNTMTTQVSNQIIGATNSAPVLDITQFSWEEKAAWDRLRAIEDALIVKNGIKKDVASMLDFKSADSLLYYIKTTYKKFPHILEHFPKIQQEYNIPAAS